MADTVTVTVSLQDSSPKLSNFGTPAILCKCPYAVDPQTFALTADGLAAMVTAGFSSYDEGYRIASAMAGQVNGAKEVKVFPRAAQNAQSVHMTPALTTVGKRYQFGVVGARGGSVDVDYTVQDSDTASDIVDAFIAQLTASAGAVITCTDASDGVYTVRISGQNYTFTAASDAIADICAGLAAAIDGVDDLSAADTATTVTVTHDGGKAVTVTSVTSPSAGLAITSQGVGPSTALWVTPTNESSVLQIVPITAGQRFCLNEWSTALTVSDESSDAGIATDIASALVEDSDWYGLIIDSTCPAEMTAAAAACIAAGKMFIGQTIDNDAGTGDDTDPFTALAGGNGLYAKVMYHKRTSQHVDACIMATVFGQGPAFGWAYLRLQNCNAPVVTGAFAGNLDSKLVGYMKSERGETFTHNTKFPGRFPDLTRGFDWFKDRVAATALSVFLNEATRGGVTFQDSGIAKFKGALLRETASGVSADLLAVDPAPYVSSLAAADVTVLDKTGRTLRGMQVIATIAGKIETLQVAIIVTP